MREKDFRRAARGALRGHWNAAVGTTLLAALLGGSSLSILGVLGNRVLQTVVKRWGQPLPPSLTASLYAIGLLSIIGLIFGGATALGLCRFNLHLVRGETARYNDLFSYYHQYFWKGFGLQFLGGLLCTLWALVLLVPGIIAGCGYAMAPYLMADNPEMGITEALRTSRQMMMGHKADYFTMNLSFFGWMLLAAFSYGIGYLWVDPYMLSAGAVFYQVLRTPPEEPMPEECGEAEIEKWLSEESEGPEKP
ncbi:MAG: DUF975 family protein [Clostridiales bacterium]|nr:DUF975 family protein [Clostridiales bacterium]